MLRALRSRGARRLRAIRFRRNRSTMWSVTQRGTAMNLHVGYRTATDEVLDALALLARRGRGTGGAVRTARALVRAFPPVIEALAEVRRELRERASRDTDRADNGTDPADHTGRSTVPGGSPDSAQRNGGSRADRPPHPGPRCAGTPAQRSYLRGLYRHVNATRFRGRLPDDIPLRFSARMRSRLGHVRPFERGGERRIAELALNIDLLLEPNDALLMDTMLHEQAHVAAWLESGEAGHGRAWKRIARRVGCVPRACSTGGLVRRRRAGDAPTGRVPPLPAAESAVEPVPGRTARAPHRTSAGAWGHAVDTQLALL